MPIFIQRICSHFATFSQQILIFAANNLFQMVCKGGYLSRPLVWYAHVTLSLW